MGEIIPLIHIPNSFIVPNSINSLSRTYKYSEMKPNKIIQILVFDNEIIIIFQLIEGVIVLLALIRQLFKEMKLKRKELIVTCLDIGICIA